MISMYLMFEMKMVAPTRQTRNRQADSKLKPPVRPIRANAIRRIPEREKNSRSVDERITKTPEKSTSDFVMGRKKWEDEWLRKDIPRTDLLNKQRKDLDSRTRELRSGRRVETREEGDLRRRNKQKLEKINPNKTLSGTISYNFKKLFTDN